MPDIFPSIHPLVAHKLSLLRDKNTEPKKFRELIREIATLLTYEATSDLILYQINIDTPLAGTTGKVLSEKICLVPILRAGLGMVEGVWHLMPSCEVWHIGLFRDENTLKPVEYYKKVPSEPNVSVCLILDPMLATGGSAVATVDILKVGVFVKLNSSASWLLRKAFKTYKPIILMSTSMWLASTKP